MGSRAMVLFTNVPTPTLCYSLDFFGYRVEVDIFTSAVMLFFSEVRHVVVALLKCTRYLGGMQKVFHSA